MNKASRTNDSIAVNIPQQRSWWQRFFFFCCDDAQSEVSRPISGSVPDNPSYQDYKPLHGQSYQELLAEDQYSRRAYSQAAIHASIAGSMSQSLVPETPKRINEQQMSRSERMLKEEVHNILILLEHYKLQLTLVLPKVLLVVRKKMQKGKKGVEETQDKLKKSLDKVRLGEIQDWGPKYSCNSESEFLSKLAKYKMLDRDIQALDLQIETAINKAMNGSDPELVITLDDPELNMDTYQQIRDKVYSVIRYKVYHQIQLRVRAQKKHKQRSVSNPNMNDSVLSTNSMAIGEDELTNLIKNLDIEGINRDVFRLYDINFGLDTTLALRKVSVLQTDDLVFMDYLDCLKEAHDRFLSYIFQGYVFNKMQQNPMHSTDLQWGVPPEFNAILNDLLDGGQGMINEEEYRLSMNQSVQGFNCTPSVTARDESIMEPQVITERLLTEVEEKESTSTMTMTQDESSQRSMQSQNKNPAHDRKLSGFQVQGASGMATTKAQNSMKNLFNTKQSKDDSGEMIFQQIEQAEQQNAQRATTMNSHRRRGTIEGLRPISDSKLEMAQKLTQQTTGSMRPSLKNKQTTNMNDTSFDNMLRD